MIHLLLLFTAVAFAAAQQPPSEPEKAEQESLSRALAEAGSSQVDFIRALELHLQRFPRTAQRPELERALAKAAIETRDGARIIKYGEEVLKTDAINLELLERVSRHLLSEDSKDRAERALGYSKKLEETARVMAPSPGIRNYAQLAEQQKILLSKALVYQSRAQGNLGRPAEATDLARQSYATYPSGEAAREIGRWLDRQGKTAEALPFWADAFSIADPALESADRQRDRQRLGEAYRKIHGSETGLGDLILAAWDRTQAQIEAYRANIAKNDPNSSINDPMQFTVSGLNGEKLRLASLKGKVVVLDFWATWCGPCRAQQPLYEEVKKRYKDNPRVVLLNINADENRELVKPFLDRNQWNKTVYFEDGLSQLLRVSSIPTTIVISPKGEIVSRMNGFIAERFVEMLTERIEQSLKEN
ncbi:MAG: TlpA family protein disulfide reductase [Acidobacteria bacterium]|nr:TlpA family protein disulfide reductase [Acidobacteriota bacterium]